LRSFMWVPLVSMDRPYGVMHLRSLKADAYTERDLDLARRVGDQIAGVIANARLHEEVEREAHEREALADIGRIVSSSLDIDEIFESFAERARDLIPFDRINPRFPVCN